MNTKHENTKIYIACGTDSCNESVAFHVFWNKKQCEEFINKENLERNGNPSYPYYHIAEGELHRDF